MPKSSDQLREQIRTLQAERRSLESKLMQPQAMLAASLVERFLGAGDSLRHSPAYYLSRSEQGRSMLTLRQEGRVGCGTLTVRCVPRLSAEPAGVAAGQRHPPTALEAVAAGPVPIKHFCSFLSISLDNQPPMCQK